MGKVVDLSPRLPNSGITANHEGVSVRVVYIGKKRMTRSFFSQIRLATPEPKTLPEKRLGWVQSRDGPRLLFEDGEGNLRRMNLRAWGITRPDGSWIPATEVLPQLFIA